ncbi:apyrase [Scaptodrosophila lebanonensis]|uniref:Apyrase n=1 Tax=Drosophila lebanonensis TaxID=7225 RepID=A0A6J2TC40_DROLE|nr:apyrase [Scaptodrosophila lebanonensis]
MQSPALAYRDLENSPRAMHMRDWRTALRTSSSYRIGNRTVRFNYHFALLIVCVFALFLLFFYTRNSSRSSSDVAWQQQHLYGHTITSLSPFIAYNDTYPLTAPIVARSGLISYRIGMIADLDTKSRVVKGDNQVTWQSFLKKGYLTHTVSSNEMKIVWDTGAPVALESSFALKDRGMELSELVTFNGKLLSFDDRTGLVYEIEGDKVVPWIILLDGDGHKTKGFKSEWATVKDQTLYVGSMGKEWTQSQGDFVNEDPMFVKSVKPSGEVKSLNWSANYKKLRRDAMEISWPGYMIHESGTWSDKHRRWFFLPRRCSKEKYNEVSDEHMGCNLLISADENFSNIKTVTLDKSNTAPTHGFSSFKFLPSTGDTIIIAIKSEELNGKTSTFITAFDTAGKTLLPEQRIETEYKYEGFEFI